MRNGFIKAVYKYRLLISSLISFITPFTLYIFTLEQKLIGGDTSWFAMQVPAMEVLAPTGYPAFSIFGKLFTLIPIRDIVYRLNLMSAFFGALTVLFLFLAIDLLVKNEIIGLASSLTFAYTISFWSIANRFELDTINSFFISLILFSAFLYDKKRDRKHLYFCFAALGLSLTDHPIAFFILPGFLLYIIVINPRIFKSIKAIFLSIIYFIIPLLLYSFLPIRSSQGYGNIHNVHDFILYITGRYTTGQIHGGTFFDKSLSEVLEVAKEFFKIIYLNYGTILIIIAAAGLIYLFKKNLKLALCSLLIIIINLGIISFYINWAPQNQVIDTLLMISVYLAMGFLLIFDSSLLLLKKLFRNLESGFQINISKRKIIEPALLKNIFIGILLVVFLVSPSIMASGNYREADQSELDDIYLFWNKIFDSVEEGSSIYVASASANIGKYISIYEQPEKKIKFVLNKDPDYTIESIRRDLEEGSKVYLVNIEDFLIPLLNIEIIFDYLWPRFEEDIIFYRVTDLKYNPEITYYIERDKLRFGDVFSIEYHLLNNNKKDITLTSLELEVPEGLSFEGVSEEGTIKESPSLSQGKYMWVKNYNINADEELNIFLLFRVLKPGESIVRFRVTSQNIYFEAEDVIIEIID